MFKRRKRILILTCLMQMIFVSTEPYGEAKDLTDVLARGFIFAPPSGGCLGIAPGELTCIADFSAAGKAVAPAFSAAISQAVTQEFPLTSVAPVFTYRLNPAVDTYERLTGVPGPLFSERAPTLGKGRLDLSVGYSFIDYSDLNGVSLNNIRSPGLIYEDFNDSVQKGRLPTGEPLFSIPLSLSQIRTRIDLKAHVVVPTLRYGIADKWEASFSLPIVSTYLRVRNETIRIADLATLRGRGPQGVVFTDPSGRPIDFSLPPDELFRQLFQFAKSTRPPASLSKATGSATGVGDLLLRTKYQFWQNGFGGAALGLTLQLPTGSARNFHGADQTHLLTFLYLSQVFKERFEPHLNLGIDFNADDVDRSSFLYAVGGTLLLEKNLGVVIDFLGRSEFGRTPIHTSSKNKVTEGSLDRAPKTCTTALPCFLKDERSFPVFPVSIKRNDIANFSFGLRYVLGASGSVFVGGIVPLNSDGFRADFIPSGGIEYIF